MEVITHIHDVLKKANAGRLLCLRTSRYSFFLEISEKIHSEPSLSVPVFQLATCKSFCVFINLPQKYGRIFAEFSQKFFLFFSYQVLLGFDLDSVGVGFDGNKVWALPRARRAINLQANLVDPTRQTFRTTS